MVIWKEIKEQALREMDKLCSNNAYHNREHIETVLNNLDTLQAHFTEALTEEENLLLRIAILYHDYAHPGYETRSDCPLEIPRKDLSNEEYSALLCEEELKEVLNSEQIELVKKIILVTSIDGKYLAETKLEKLMVFVDVANFMNDPQALDDDAVKLSKENCSGDILSADSREKFLIHLQKKLENIKEYISEEFFQISQKRLIIFSA